MNTDDEFAQFLNLFLKEICHASFNSDRASEFLQGAEFALSRISKVYFDSKNQTHLGSVSYFSLKGR